jgi:hypothetical protein
MSLFKFCRAKLWKCSGIGKILTLAGTKTARVGMRGPSCLLYLSIIRKPGARCRPRHCACPYHFVIVLGEQKRHNPSREVMGDNRRQSQQSRLELGLLRRRVFSRANDLRC